MKKRKTAGAGRAAAVLCAVVMLAGCGSYVDDEPEGELVIRSKETQVSAAPEGKASSTGTTTTKTTDAETTTEKTTKKTKKTTAETTVTETETTTEKTTTTSEVTTTTAEQTTTPPPETEPPAETTAATTAETTTAATEATAPPAPKQLTAASFMVATTLSTTNITWDAVDGATGYSVYVRRSKDGNWEHLADTTETKWSTDKFGRDPEYSFTVKPYTEEKGERKYAEQSEVSEFPYLTQKNGITYVDGLLLVNKTYPLPKSYAPGGLTPETQAAFNEMKSGAAKDGYSLWVCSGYRSYDYQNTLYWGYVNREGSQAEADRFSARPGHSEHQSGLAADINYASRYFNGSPEAEWLKANAWKYGFIIRYPEDKEEITGYRYESWHVRYVGKELSKILTESGLTVEEYYGVTSQYNY